MSKLQNDCDEVAWDFYKKYYGKCLFYDATQNEYVVKVKSTEIYVNGDVCFNTKLKYKTRYSLLGSLIKESSQFKDMNQLLSELRYSPMNISILPKTGGLNIIKKNFADDRLDSFIWLLNQYYRGVTAPIVNRGTVNSCISNQLLLKCFLDKFKSEKEFCLFFYGLEDEKFVSKLIGSGQRAICNISDLYQFLKLAIEFWTIRLSVLEKRNILVDDQCAFYKEKLAACEKMIGKLK